MTPSGNTSQAAQDYYMHLWSHRLSEINVPTIFIDWWPATWAAIFGVSLILFFFLYTRTFNTVHRRRGELYGLTSFGGQLAERVGRSAWFSRIVWTAIALWAAYYAVIQAIRGQIY